MVSLLQIYSSDNKWKNISNISCRIKCSPSLKTTTILLDVQFHVSKKNTAAVLCKGGNYELNRHLSSLQGKDKSLWILGNSLKELITHSKRASLKIFSIPLWLESGFYTPTRTKSSI